MAESEAKTRKIRIDEKLKSSLLNWTIIPNDKVSDYSALSAHAVEEYPTETGPADYLKLFEAFVNNNPEHIEAIEVLLSRPARWNTDVLDELREKLRKSDFSEKDLQRGHELVYKKPLADIISMVKHASNYDIPILTAKERVEKAVTKLIEKHSFTDEQLNWLSYIKGHLIENLAISQDDFEIMPVFERRGGLNKARQIFGADFESMIQEINATLAA